MPGNLQTIPQGTMTLVATSTVLVDIDRSTLESLTVLFKAVYAATSSPTGLVVTIYDGFGNADPDMSGGLPYKVGGSLVPTYTTAGTVYTLNSGLAPGSGSPQTCSQDISFTIGRNVSKIPRWIRLSIFNQDTANACVLTLLADV